MQRKHLPVLLICVLSFTVVLHTCVKNEYPLSWDVWYHLRISRQFSEGTFWWDSGSFGPEGRAHTYPPVFHVITAFLYKITGIPLQLLAQILTPFLFCVTVYSFYYLVNHVFDHKTAVVSCLFAAVSPLLLDRGVSYTPEALAFIFFNFGLVSFWQKKWKIAGILGGLLVLTHGLASVAFFFVILFYTGWSFIILRENVWKRFFQVFILMAIIPAVWVVNSIPAFVPQGFVYPLTVYPEKLGWIQVLLAFFGLTWLKKDKKSVFVLSCAGSLFLLSRYSVSLPYRFTEFLVFPVCMLAGRGYIRIKAVRLKSLRINPHLTLDVAIVFLVFLSFTQGYWYIEKYRPVITTEEVAAFTWLNTSSVESTVITEWRTAPVLAYFSGRPPVKGAYQFGAPNLVERTEDTKLFYQTYDETLLSKYNISFVYYGIEEGEYNEPPFDKVYTTVNTGIYHPGLYQHTVMPTLC